MSSPDELERRLRVLLAEMLRDWGDPMNAAWATQWLRRAARIGAELEREECAKVAAEWALAVDGGEYSAIVIAEDIRDRGSSG